MDILLFVITFVLASGFRRFVGGVCPEDRRIAVLQYLWVYGPITVVCCVHLFSFVMEVLGLFGAIDYCGSGNSDCVDAELETGYTHPILGLGYTAGDIMFRLLAAFFASSWALASAPIVRVWVLSKASDSQRFAQAEENAVLTRSQKAIEPHISVPAYYSLIIGVFAMTFLVFESILGETFERITGISGYFGAVIATLIVASLFGPIKKRADAYVANLKTAAQAKETDDAASAAREVLHSTSKLWTSILKDWPMVLIYMLIVIAVFFHMITYVLKD